MLVIEKRVNNTNFTTQELNDKLKIEKTNFSDIMGILKIMTDCFKIPTTIDAYNYLYLHKLNILNSVKLVDKDTNEIYGVLLLGEVPMADVTPIMFICPTLNCVLNKLKQLNGIAFIIDERLRGQGWDKKMLYSNISYINQFDIVWCGVDATLKTHHYWERLGFDNLFNDSRVNFYAKVVKKH